MSRRFSSEYEAFINSPEWRATRMNILIRDKQRCQMCRQRGSKDVRLSVHHRYGYDISTRTKPSILITLCMDCHAKHHDKMDQKFHKKFRKIKTVLWDPYKPRKEWEKRVYWVPRER